MAFRLSPHLTVMANAAQKAAKRLLRDFAEVEQLQVSVKGPSDFVSQADLRAEADSRDAEIATYLEGNAEVAEVVHALERQYDAFQRAVPCRFKLCCHFGGGLAGTDDNGTPARPGRQGVRQALRRLRGGDRGAEQIQQEFPVIHVISSC